MPWYRTISSPSTGSQWSLYSLHMLKLTNVGLCSKTRKFPLDKLSWFAYTWGLGGVVLYVNGVLREWKLWRPNIKFSIFKSTGNEHYCHMFQSITFCIYYALKKLTFIVKLIWIVQYFVLFLLQISMEECEWQENNAKCHRNEKLF